MKRKRGHKKGKYKQAHADDDSVLEDLHNVEVESDNEPATATIIHTPHGTDGFTDRPSGVQGRVKVKLKSSKLLDPPHSDADAHTQTQTQTQSDTDDKSSSHMSLEVVENNMYDGEDFLLADIQPTASAKYSRKTSSIKIKSSRGIASLTTTTNQTSGPLHCQGDRIVIDDHKTIASSMSNDSHQKEHNLPRQDARYNKQELNTALAVIQKIMKMDAAEPFNAPVDPVALGIPDYFDIIEIPMDFGTICNNIEEGHIYKNSEDVFKDVQYIWENCYKYNNKGDYIVDLMRRVKKNFMKYWTAAGLYTRKSHVKGTLNGNTDDAPGQYSRKEVPVEDDQGKERIFVGKGRMSDIMSKKENGQPLSLNASARLQMETAPLPSQERLHVKGTNAKYKKRGRHGFHKHKSDCLCAVCVMRRRRREREMNAKIVENRIEISDGNASKEFKQEETPIENLCSEDASSNLGHSPETDADGDLEVQGEEMKLERLERHGSAQQGINEENAEMRKTVRNNYFDQYQLGHGSREEHNLQSQSEEMEDSSIMIQKHNRKDDTPPQEEARQFQKFQQKQIKGQQQTLMSKNLHLNENPTIMELCGTLFPSNRKSAWSGPHSLVCHDMPVRRSSAIHAALEMFMK